MVRKGEDTGCWYTRLMIKGLTQRQIAEKMGAHQPNVSAWLSGKTMPDTPNLERLAKAMEMEPDQLLAMIYRRRKKRLSR